MICDDSAHARRALEAGLTNAIPANWEVVCVEHGEEAVEATEKEEMDLVLMDFHLSTSGGKMNGAEATTALLEKYPDLKVIGVTSNAAQGEPEREMLLKAGCLDVWGKPVRSVEFSQALFGDKYGANPDTPTGSFKAPKVT
jgi:CheY-like chemotaxis protein